MALLPEASTNVGAGKDPATAYAPPPTPSDRQATRAAPAVRTIEVVARRFAFEPATIDVQVGERIRLLVSSADGVHGVGIRKFKVNTLVPRGGRQVEIVQLVELNPDDAPPIVEEFKRRLRAQRLARLLSLGALRGAFSAERSAHAVFEVVGGPPALGTGQ